MYDLLIFDLDGTLVDSVGDIADALNRTLAELGLPPYADGAVARMVGSGVRELVRRALGPERQVHLDRAVARYRAHYEAQPVRRTSLYLGVAPTLDALAGVDKAVATNKPGALARRVVEELGIARHFVAVLGEDDVGRAKPDPLIVDVLRGKTGAARGRTLYIGDSLVDAATAEAARVDLALVTYGYADPATITAHPAKFHLQRFGDTLSVVSSGNK
jgi:phosphoglycolate phosphatase